MTYSEVNNMNNDQLLYINLEQHFGTDAMNKFIEWLLEDKKYGIYRYFKPTAPAINNIDSLLKICNRQANRYANDESYDWAENSYNIAYDYWYKQALNKFEEILSATT